MKIWTSGSGPGRTWLIRAHRPSSGSRTLQIFTLGLAFAVLMMTLDLPWKHVLGETYVPPPPPTLLGSQTPSVMTRSMEEPLRLIQEARQAFARVRDYECTLIKQERIDGKLTPENVIQLRARTEPNSVSLTWQQPSSQAGQEACYVAGKNHGKLRARGAGALSLIGFVSLDPQSPRARGASKYAITEAGLGYLIERFATGWQLEDRLGCTDVRIEVGEFNGRPGLRVETIHPRKIEGLLYHRSVVWFDQMTNLPMRVENYDWPRVGETHCELAEQFSFVNVRLNVGLSDEVFNR